MLKNFCSVQDLVTHIYTESKKFYEGTEFEDNWYFYHDALSLMTAKSTIEWMADVGYLKHWLLPVHGLNSEFKRYKGRPIGNSPEMMPWDCSLNMDLIHAVDQHCVMTALYAKDESPI